MVVAIAIMTMIGMIEIQDDVSEQHMLMMVMAPHQMLDTRHSAGHGRLHENQHQRDANQRARLLCRQVPVRFHPCQANRRWSSWQ
ncbi:MAG TPA: hypothetical protein VH189_07880 [Rhizomicrobium sp.]|nr:hypothetical protein [Rhizomicrobium sp.]